MSVECPQIPSSKVGNTSTAELVYFKEIDLFRHKLDETYTELSRLLAEKDAEIAELRSERERVWIKQGDEREKAEEVKDQRDGIAAALAEAKAEIARLTTACEKEFADVEKLAVALKAAQRELTKLKQQLSS